MINKIKDLEDVADPVPSNAETWPRITSQAMHYTLSPSTL